MECHWCMLFPLLTQIHPEQSFPRHPMTLSEDDWGVQSRPKRKVFRFHETILSFGEPGSLGFSKHPKTRPSKNSPLKAMVGFPVGGFLLGLVAYFQWLLLLVFGGVQRNPYLGKSSNLTHILQMG